MKSQTNIFRIVLSFSLAMLFALATGIGLKAQVSPYWFSHITVAYAPITGGTLLGTATNDDQFFVDPAIPLGGTVRTGVGFPIGFNFTFQGIVFNRFGVNANGWISLGQSALTTPLDMNTTSAYTPLSSTFANVPAHLRSRISALGRDLEGQTGATLRFELIGTTPNRVLVIQWANYKRFGTTGAGDFFNFQIRLHETTNRVDFHYGSFVMGATSGVYQVGLGGTLPADFNNRTTTTNWAATTAGTVNTATCTISLTVFPPNGLMFTFTPPAPGHVTGIVRDAATNNPLIGALVSSGTRSFLTMANGVYTLSDLLPGSNTITVQKPGYGTINQVVTIIPAQTITQNFLLNETPNPPGVVNAVVNAAGDGTIISWAAPDGLYEIIYDDGVAENTTAWGLDGNMNALRFTPAGHPAKIMKGSVNIGDGTWPAGTTLTPFELAIYDDDGPNGFPGTELGVVNVTPTAHGWVTVDFNALNITITSGDFYLVMVQGGNFPNCAPIAIDQSNPVFRSYSRFATGGAPWTLAGFNDFMMRAVVMGPGGPNFLAAGTEYIESGRISVGALHQNPPVQAAGFVGTGIFKPIHGSGSVPEDVEWYRIWRLVEGQEGNEALWVHVGNETGLIRYDAAWPTLPDGPYRWAVKAKYPDIGGQPVFSAPSFSNVLRKNWSSNVTVNVTLSDPDVPLAGISVGLVNTVFPQYTFNATTNAAGTVNFPEVWKGNYNLQVFKFGYTMFTENVNITENTTTRNVHLLEIPNPPSGLTVDPITLMATWQAPAFDLDLLEENWSSGNFTANNWTFAPSQGNWAINTAFGNPAPGARFNWSPTVTNYSFALESKTLNGIGMPSIYLRYSLHLSNFSTATLEQMAVEVWNGSAWVQVANHTNAAGNIAWTTFTQNISAHALGQQFKVRFRAYGANSYNINNWDVDNIHVYGEVQDGGTRGVLGYFLFLDDILVGFTEETSFQLQPTYVNYGQTYTAAVKALYEVGFSPAATHVFTSQFLFEPCNLEGEDLGHSVRLTWEAPGTCWTGGGGGGGGGGTGANWTQNFDGGTLPTGWNIVQTNTTTSGPTPGFWTVNTYSSADFSPFGTHHVGLWWDYAHQDEWIITPEFAADANTELTFWTVVFRGSTYQDNYFVKVSTDGGTTWTPIWNATTLTGGWNYYNTPFTLSLAAFAGQDIRVAFHATDGPSNDGLWYIWFLDNIAVSSEAGTIVFKPEDLIRKSASQGDNTQNHQVARDGSPARANFVPLPQSIIAPETTGTLSAAIGTEPGTTAVGFQAAADRNQIEIHYDGGFNNNGIGTGGAAVFSAAARFTPTELGQYYGTYEIASVRFHVFQPGFNNVTVKIWQGGSLGNPGTEIYSQDVTAQVIVGQWTTHTLPAPIPLVAGNEYWIGYSISATTGHPASVDAGPMVVGKGGWIFFNNVWQELTTFALNFNWCIRGVIQPVTGGGGGGQPVETIGFNIYRNGTLLTTVGPNVFTFTDTSIPGYTYMPAGTYEYSITALYSHAGGTVESQHEGPIDVVVAPGNSFLTGIVYDVSNNQPIQGVTITAGPRNTVTQANGGYTLVGEEGVWDVVFDKIGYALYTVPNFSMPWNATQTLNVGLTPQAPNFPLEEPWTAGNFTANGWTFVPSQGNWSVNTTAGNPAPSARFNWSPSLTNYSFALTSLQVDARAATTNVTLTFDKMLDNFSATGAEKMRVDIWNGTTWVQVVEFTNDADKPWATHAFDVTQHASGKMTRIRFVAHGASSFNIDWWQIDNIKLHEVLPSQITVNPASMTAEVVQGTTLVQQLNIGNLGLGELTWNAAIQFPSASSFDPSHYTGEGEIEAMVSTTPGGEPIGFQSTRSEQEVEIHYDGGYDNNGIGTGGVASFMTAARFTPAELAQYYGVYNIKRVRFHIHQPSFSNVTVKIWQGGTATNPGTEVYSQDVTGQVIVGDWTTHTLTTPIDLVAGNDYWIGYSIDATGGHPASVDAGPIVPGKGGWIFFNNVWQELTAFALSYNWCIRGVLAPTGPVWLTLNPTSGAVPSGGNVNVDVTFNAQDMNIGLYTANIVINSNDPMNPIINIPVLMDVRVGVPEVEADMISVYPIPASTILNVTMNEAIRSIRMFSYTGQLVYERNVVGENVMHIDVTPLQSGAYILQFITADGQTYQRRVIVNR